MKLYEIGRTVDLKEAQKILMSDRVKFKLKRKRGTPDYINLESPLLFTAESISEIKLSGTKMITGGNISCKIYEDGVISIIARILFDGFELDQFHEIPDTIIPSKFGKLSIEQWADSHFKLFFNEISSTIEIGMYSFVELQAEYYSIFCIHDNIEDPDNFIMKNGRYLALLLMDEDPSLLLHQSQIDNTLSNPFSFLANDLIIYDLDRTLIIDPNKDYEDILLIIELAVYQFLELRVLDLLSDQFLETVETDLRLIFKKRKFLKNINKKLKNLLPFHYDLIFILENIENTSKIIGDFFLAKQFEHLCTTFEVHKWSHSIRDRIDYLEKIFEMAKNEMNEKTMLLLEAGLAVLFTVEFLLFFF